jgi:multicomponent Na+:H+ antiporter subunit G
MFVGGIFSVIGSLGLVRFPDVYIRSHAQTVVNVGGIVFILVGVMIESFFSTLFIKALFLIIFIYVTSPVGTHAITKAAYLSGVKPIAKKDEWKKLKR